jgi:hypothetical protein
MVSVLALLALLCSVPRPARAAESYDNCTGFITSLPAFISTQGIWCLKQDLATGITAGNAITINAYNVTIDCNGFKIGGLAAGAGTAAIGIYELSQLNATVRHCRVRGFYYGLNFEGGGGNHLIEDNRFDNNTYVGLRVAGDGSIVRRNVVVDTGGSTQPTTDAYGLRTVDAVDVQDNTVAGVTAATSSSAAAYGIYVYDNPSGSIAGNRVRAIFGDGIGAAHGIYLAIGGRSVVAQNHVFGNGATGSTGIMCEGSSESVLDNVISGFATGLVCHDDGGNVIRP